MRICNRGHERQDGEEELDLRYLEGKIDKIQWLVVIDYKKRDYRVPI